MKSLLYILTAIGLFLVVFFSTMLIQLVRAQPFTLEDEVMLRPKAVSAIAVWAPTNAYTYYKTESLSGNNGDSVTHWTDSAAAPHDAWAYGGNQPFLTNNIIGGKSAVWWLNSATARAITNAFGSTLAQPITIVTAVNSSAHNGSGFLWDGVGDGSARMTANWSAVSIINYGAGANLTVTNGPVPNTWCVLSICYNGTGSYVRTNGVLCGTGNTSTGGTKGFTFGARYQLDVDSSSVMGLAEWILYKGQLATNDLMWTEKGLCTKLGITYAGP